jgi:aromatic-L-amino-acid/L-tryptophan decarboxylase
VSGSAPAAPPDGDDEGLGPALDLLAREALAFRSSVAAGPVQGEADPDEIRRALADGFDFASPVPLPELTSQAAALLRRWTLHVTHPAYFGLFNPSVDAAGIAADALAALYNPQLAAWSHAPVANEIERHAIRFLASHVWPTEDGVDGSFTSGGAEANLTAALAALVRRFPSFGDTGARGLTGDPLIYLSEAAHHSFVKIAAMTGLGRRAIRVVPVDGDGRLDAPALSDRIRADLQAGAVPTLVVGTAGTTAEGAVDPLPEIARIAREHGAWFHVDAAWGGSACLSPRLRPLLAGIEDADSVTWDAHKWLSVPMGAGMFLCRHPAVLRAAFRTSTGYMPADVRGADDPYLSTVQWSRRFTGLKVFMTLARLGRAGIAARIERQSEMGDLLREGLRADGWQVVNRTALPVVCFRHPRLRNREAYESALAALYRRGRAWVSIASSGGAPAFRACITSYRTGPEHLSLLRGELALLLSNCS